MTSQKADKSEVAWGWVPHPLASDPSGPLLQRTKDLPNAHFSCPLLPTVSANFPAGTVFTKTHNFGYAFIFI